VPRAAGPRRLPAAVSVRGLVPVAGARCRPHRAHGRGRGRRLPGAALTALGAVRAALAAEGGLLADALGPEPSADGALGAAAASGPRSAGHEADIAFVVEAIREGELLHYGATRLFADIEPDLALLAGDRLYALGLARLAALGDVEAVAELSDVIALCAQAQAEGRPELSDAVWQAGVAAVGWGATDALRAAKAAAREGDPGAPDALRSAALAVRGA
jgi:hypothetical protein